MLEKQITQTPCSLDVFDGWFTPNSYANDFREIPDRPGVYLLVAVCVRSLKALVCYAGMSRNLSKRLENHPVKRLCEARFDYVKVYFKEERSGLRTKEKALIREFNPLYNLQHKMVGV